MNDITTLIQKLPQIESETRYWFVRTEGGRLYSAFISSGSIAIGYPKITPEILNSIPSDELDFKVKPLVEKYYPYKKSPGLAANQLITFCRKIKKGDIIIIPSRGTWDISVGIVSEGKIFEQELKTATEIFPEFTKRLKVNWLSKHDRNKVNPNLLRILSAHQTIVDATEFDTWIDPLMFDFFTKGEDIHLVIKVEKESHINAKVLFKTCLDLFEMVDKFSVTQEFGGTSNEIETRINLNSPGNVELIAKTRQNAKWFFCLALIVFALNGGGLKFEAFGIKTDMHSNGLIEEVNKFLNDESNRELSSLLREKIKELKIQDTDDIVNLMEEQSGKK